MKWEIRDINVVERANIPTFFDDVLVDMIVGYTKVYSHREKVDISFEITNEKIRIFLRMLLLNG